MSWVYSELLDSRKQGCAIDAHSCRSSIRTTDPPLAFGEGAHNVFALLHGIFVSKIFLIV